MHGPTYPHMQMPGNPLHRQMQMTALPFSTGSSIADMMLMMRYGNQLAPRPQPGTTQGLYDAMYLRQRTMQMREAQLNALGTSMPLARLGGVNQQSMAFQAFGSMLGDPNGPAANFLSPLIGGNPMKAQMGMLANLNTQSMSTFGRMGSITLPETSRMMDSLNRFAYNYRPRSNADLSRGRADVMGAAQRHGINDQIEGLFNGDRLDEGRYDAARGRNKRLADFQSAVGSAGDTGRLNSIKQQMIEAFSDQKTKNAIEEAFTKGNGKGKETAKELDNILKIKTMNQMLGGQLAGHFNDQNNVGKMLPSGINYGNTMGINLEDFSSAFTSAASMKLFNKSGSFEKFLGTKNAGGMLDSLKGIFGNDRSGSELMEGLNDLLGSSHVDLGDAKDSGRVESLMRNLKALSRNTDIAVEAMVGLIKDANNIAARTPGMQHMGGTQTIPMVMRAVANANAMSMVGSNDFVRRSGGLPGLIQSQIQAEMESTNQPITKQVAAMWHLAERTGGQAGANAKAMIENYRTGAAGLGYNSAGFGALTGQIARTMGMSASQVLNYTQNEDAQALGLRANGDLSQIGGAAVTSRFVQLANQQGRMSGQGNNYGQRVLAYLNNRAAKSEDMLDPELLKTDPFLSQNPAMREFVAKNATVLANHAMRGNGKYMSAQKELRDRNKTQLAMEKSLTEKFGHLNAPAGQSLLNQLFTMSPDSATFSRLMDPILAGHTVNGLQDLAENASEIHRSKNMGELTARVQFQDDQGRNLTGAAREAKVGLLSAYSEGGLGILAKAGSKTEQEMLRGLAGKSDPERKKYLDELTATLSGADKVKAEKFAANRDFKKDLVGLNAMGLGSVDSFSDFKSTQQALINQRKNSFLEKAAGKELGMVNDKFRKGLAGVVGAGALTGALGGKLDALQAEKVLAHSYDADRDVDGKLREARTAFNRNTIGERLSTGYDDETDTYTFESDADYDARARKDKRFKDLHQKTATSAGFAHQVRNAAGLDRPEVKASEDLSKTMEKLIGFVKDLPQKLDDLAKSITKATEP